MKKEIHITLAEPRGFCAGVDRAITIVEKALEKYGAPIYVRHEVVHNEFVIENLKRKGAVFVEDMEDIPKGSHVIYSAHGVSKLVRKKASDFNKKDSDKPYIDYKIKSLPSFLQEINILKNN